MKKSRAVWVLESGVSGLRLGLMVTKREHYGPFFVETYEGLKGLMASNIGIPSILVISFDPFCPSEALGYSGFRGLVSGGLA